MTSSDGGRTPGSGRGEQLDPKSLRRLETDCDRTLVRFHELSSRDADSEAADSRPGGAIEALAGSEKGSASWAGLHRYPGQQGTPHSLRHSVRRRAANRLHFEPSRALNVLDASLNRSFEEGSSSRSPSRDRKPRCLGMKQLGPA